MRGVSISNFLIFIKFLFFFTNYDRFQALVFDKFAKEKIYKSGLRSRTGSCSKQTPFKIQNKYVYIIRENISKLFEVLYYGFAYGGFAVL